MMRFVLAPSKLNLALRVLAREASGFHQIETIFCAIELADELEIDVEVGGISLDVRSPADDPAPPPDLGEPHTNLAWRAAELFFAATRSAPAAHIVLTKRIPAGAGLGGGSSDAAAVLRTLNDMHGEPLSTAHLLELGARLGSDVPFFLAGAQIALAWGRGTRILPMEKLPSRPVLLALPTFGVNTADAYRRIAAARYAEFAAPPSVLHMPRNWDDLAALARNDFEDVIFDVHPALRDLRDDIEASGAGIARMTGTGSVVFGVFEEMTAAENALHGLESRHDGVRWILTRTT